MDHNDACLKQESDGRQRKVAAKFLVNETEQKLATVYKISDSRSSIKDARNLVAGSTGYEVSQRQIAKYAKDNSGTSDAGLFAQLAALPELFRQLRRTDKDGTYVLQTEQTPWSANSFGYFFVAFGACKELQREKDFVAGVSYDACHNKNNLQGKIVYFCGLDPQSKANILAFGFMNQESAYFISEMLRLFRESYPSVRCIINDEGSAFLSGRVGEVSKGTTTEMLATV